MKNSQLYKETSNLVYNIGKVPRHNHLFNDLCAMDFDSIEDLSVDAGIVSDQLALVRVLLLLF